jgi:hypothetical protein
VLVDLPELQQQAQQQGGELSYRKLLRAIAGERTVARAICYVGPDTPEAVSQALAQTGFELLPKGDPATAAVAMAVDAMAMAPDVSAMALAPLHGALPPLLRSLQARGVLVEAAGFGVEAPAGVTPRRLGRECIFVP